MSYNFPSIGIGEPVADHDAQATLALAERRFQATFHHAPVGIAHVALDGTFLLLNPRFCEITGYPATALVGTGFQRITHPDDLHVDEALLARLHAGEFPRYTMEKRYIRIDGSVIWINLTVAMVRDDAGAPELYIAVIEDLSDLRQAHHDSTHDALTGLFNRRGFAAHAGPLLDRAAHSGQPVSIVYLDLDGFKGLNDRQGHAVGDECLIDVGRLMRERLRPHDVVARIGGDEFILLLPGLTDAQAVAMVERLRDALVRWTWKAERISGSFGLLTTVPTGGDDLPMLIERADHAMLGAKRAGRNQVLVAAAG